MSNEELCDELDEEQEVPKKIRAPKAAESDESGLDVETQLRGLFSKNSDMAFDVAVLKHNPQTKTYPQITSYKDICDIEDVVSTEEIGRQYGGGKYKLIVKYADKSGKPQHWSRVFELDKAYDRFAQASAPAPPQAQQSAGVMNGNEMVAMLNAQAERTMQMMMAMMTSSQNAMQGIVAAMAGGKKEESVNGELLKEIIKNSRVDAMGQLKTAVQVLKEVSNLNSGEDDLEREPEEEEEDEPEEDDLLTQVGKAILPSIGEMMNPGREQAQQTAKQ